LIAKKQELGEREGERKRERCRKAQRKTDVLTARRINKQTG
jgi:hypothetical protein